MTGVNVIERDRTTTNRGLIDRVKGPQRGVWRVRIARGTDHIDDVVANAYEAPPLRRRSQQRYGECSALAATNARPLAAVDGCIWNSVGSRRFSSRDVSQDERSVHRLPILPTSCPRSTNIQIFANTSLC